MATKEKENNNVSYKRTIKISVQNHKQLSMYKIENEFRSMDEALGALLQNHSLSTHPGSTSDTDEI